MKLLSFAKDLLILIAYVIITLFACLGGEASGAFQATSDKYNEIQNKYFK